MSGQQAVPEASRLGFSARYASKPTVNRKRIILNDFKRLSYTLSSSLCFQPYKLITPPTNFDNVIGRINSFNHFDFSKFDYKLTELDLENQIIGSSQLEENLQELLEAAERRKISEIKQTSKNFSLIVGIPIVLFIDEFPRRFF